MATLGSSPSWYYAQWYGASSNNQAWTGPYTMPTAGVVTAIVFYAAAFSGTTAFIGGLWNASSGAVLVGGGGVAVGAGSLTAGGQQWNTSTVSNLFLANATQVNIGWFRTLSQNMEFSQASNGVSYTKNAGASIGPATGGTPTPFGAIGAYIIYTPVNVPTATTAAATGITNTTATLNATVGDGGMFAAGGGTTAAYFRYSTSSILNSAGELASGTSVNASTSPFSGTSQAETYALTGLATSTTYYFQSIVSGGQGTTYGTVFSFTTVGTPNAPTLTTPVNGTAATLSQSGQTFSWMYNSGGAAGGQTAYAFEMATNVNMSGGLWWTGSAWSSTQTYVTSSAGSVTIPNTAWTSGTFLGVGQLYWTVSNQDANGTGQYANAYSIIDEQPPASPTLLTPAPGSRSDVQATPTFTWQYNPTSSVGGQTNYAFRQKISGGAYGYYNGTDFSSATVVWNTSSATSITFGAGLWVDGNTYNWSVATQDVGGQGPFATDATVTAQVAPIVVITSPTGTINVTQPIVNWTATIAPGAAQSSWQVTTYEVGHTPLGVTRPPIDDSGVVSGRSLTYQIGTVLPVGASFTTSVNITETGGQSNNFNASTSFTIALDVPPTPVLTALATNDPITGMPMIQLQVQMQLNLLSQGDASIENALAGYPFSPTAFTYVGTNCTLAQTTVTALDGEFSLQMTSNASAAMTATTGFYPCLPNTAYSAMASFQCHSGNANTTAVNLLWYDTNFNFLSTSAGSNTGNDTPTTWVQATLTATSPSNAAYFKLQPQVNTAASARVHYLDCAAVFVGSGITSWSAGSFLNGVGFQTQTQVGFGSTTIFGAGLIILRSDGVYVRNASLANPALVPANQLVTVNDYEVTPTVAYSYSAYYQGYGYAGWVQSATNTAGAAISGGQGFWEVDPLNPSTAVAAQPTSWNPSQTEQSSAHAVLGQATQNVVAYAMQLPDMTATFTTFTGPIYTGLVALSTSQKTIFISDPFGLSYYFRLAIAPGGLSLGSGSTAHSTQLFPSTAAGPYRDIAISGVAQPRPPV